MTQLIADTEPNIAAHSHLLYSNDNRNMTRVCVTMHFMKLFKAKNIQTSLALLALSLTLTLQTAQCHGLSVTIDSIKCLPSMWIVIGALWLSGFEFHDGLPRAGLSPRGPRA